MAKVDRKKLLNEPDEFITVSDKAVRWIQENLNIVIIGVVAVAVVLSAVIGTKAYIEHREDTAANTLAPVMSNYADLLNQKADQAKIKQAEDALATLVAEYGATTAGMQARMALGSLQAEKGKWQKALDTYTALCDEEDLAADFKPLAYRGKAQALEGLKKYDQAAEAYAEAAKTAGPNQAMAFKFDQARVLAAAGKKDQAKALYREVLGQKPDPQTVAAATAQLVALGESVPQSN